MKFRVALCASEGEADAVGVQRERMVQGGAHALAVCTDQGDTQH